MPVRVPRRIRQHTPVRFVSYVLTGYGIIIHYVITAVIGTEMVLHGGIGMLHGNIIISGIA